VNTAERRNKMKGYFKRERGYRAWIYQIKNSDYFIERTILKNGIYIIQIFHWVVGGDKTRDIKFDI
jgi:hypothetical protein